MRKDIFENIWGFAEGRLFLLNLCDSCELSLLSEAHMEEFLNGIESIPETARSNNRWWLYAISPHTILSQCVPILSGHEQFSTVVCIPQGEDNDPEDEFFGVSAPGAGRLAAANERIFKSRQSKKVYWLSDTAAMSDVTLPDDVRDRLGLDWAGEDMVLYRIGVPSIKVETIARRPSGLSRGSARFKALREDDIKPSGYEQWGMTVDLKKWRHAKASNDSIKGAPELVANIGPLNSSGVGDVSRLGVTRNPSGCTSDADHKKFSGWLNQHHPLKPDEIYNRLAKSVKEIVP